MDLLTQGLLGGVLALTAAKKTETRSAAIAGFAAGLLADADILINSGSDPLLNLEYHRHFTHSLAFIPIGALVAALLLWPLLRKRLSFFRLSIFTFLGYATSGLLDACTSYGTHLLWPFNDERIAWNLISIVDPVFSLCLLLGLIFTIKRANPGPARISLVLASLYLLAGFWQYHRALDQAYELAQMRGHSIARVVVKPTLANLVLWRSVYHSGDQFYVDAIRVGIDTVRIYPGQSVVVYRHGIDMPHVSVNSILARDIERFGQLSDGFVTADPGRDKVLMDIRYSMLPNTITPMWGIDLDLPTSDQHARFYNYRDRPDRMREKFIAMLFGRDLP
ncbi:MAG: metal-dependent hydrolase [Pseudomonadota bacterium]